MKKAKEYVELFNKFIDTKDEKDLNSALINLAKELYSEQCELIKARGKTATSLIGCIKEINTKNNSISRILEKRLGFSVLKIDGWIEHEKKRIPEIIELAKNYNITI
jgi:hypothetical protein